MSYIDFSRIVQHDWKKLRKIWKDIHRDYKKAMGKYTQSGTHESNFFGFCDNKVEVYYLWRKLKLRPDLNEFVGARLPEGCAIASDRAMMPDPDDISPVSSSGGSKRKQKQSATAVVGAEFASVLNKIGESFSHQAVARNKDHELFDLRSALFQQRNDRDVKRLKMEEDRLMEEKNREDTRLGLEKKKVELEERKADLLEWEKVLQGIKDHRAELSSPNLRESDKASIYAEIDDLTQYRALLLEKKKKNHNMEE